MSTATRSIVRSLWIVAAGVIAGTGVLFVAMPSRPPAVTGTPAPGPSTVPGHPSTPTARPAGAAAACQDRRSELAALEVEHDRAQRTSRTEIDALRARVSELDKQIARLRGDLARLERLFAAASITAARLEAPKKKLQALVAARDAVAQQIVAHETRAIRSGDAVAAARLLVQEACAP